MRTYHIIVLLAIASIRFINSYEISELGESLFQQAPIIEESPPPEFYAENLPWASIEDSKAVLAAPDSLADYAGEPSTLIAGCVNAVSGHYVERAQDLSIQGPELLNFERAYCSAEGFGEELFSNWKHNHGGRIHLSKHGKNKTILEELENPHSESEYWATWVGPCGISLKFIGDSRTRHDIFFSLGKREHKRGLTNLGPISGKHNINNFKMIYARKTIPNHAFLRKGDGTIYAYKRHKSESLFNLIQEKKINGHRLYYTYGRENRLSSVELGNSNSRILSALKLYYESPQKITLAASDGRICEYSFHRIESDKKFFYALAEIKSPGGYQEKFTYSTAKDPSNRQLIKKKLPNGRYVEINYYSKEEDHKKFKRVSQLKAPVGAGSEAVITYRFDYSIHKHHCRTDVRDTYANKTSYNTNEDGHLTEIVKYTTANKPYLREQFLWENDGNQCANMRVRLIKDANHYPVLFRHYTYDSFGNIVKDSVYGNLTGREVKLLPLNVGSLRSLNLELWLDKCDVDTKRYIYSHDELNLLLTELDAHQTITYSYLQGTNLPSSKLTWEGERLRIRQFYTYDSNNTMIEEIVDNGVTDDRYNLSGITERRIKRILPTNIGVIGLPEEVDEFYLDLISGKEVRLKRAVNTYSAQGWLIQQDLFDANNQYICSLAWDYNERGQIILEKDPMGRKIIRKYDANGLLVLEQAYTAENTKELTYDYANRLIKQNHHGQEVSYVYDLMGRCISKTDNYGHITRYIYDEFGRVIETELPEVANEEGVLVIPRILTNYNILGQPVKVIGPKGEITQTQFTLRGQPYRTVYPDGSETSCVYGCDGLLLKETSQGGLTTEYTYDYLKRVTKQATYDAQGNGLMEHTYTYNAFHLTKETDASGLETFYSYDGAGREIARRKGDTFTTKSYDPQGNCIRFCSYTSATNFIAECREYDLLGRIVSEWTENSVGQIQRKTDFGYDIYGNRCTIAVHTNAGLAITQVEYNCRGQIIRQLNPEDHETRFIYLQNVRNDHGQLVPCKEEIDPLGCKLATFEDALGRPQKIVRSNPLGKIIQYKEHFYDMAGNLCKTFEIVINSNQTSRDTTVRWEYDCMKRMTAQFEAEGTPLQKITRYVYNQNGQKEVVAKPDGKKIMHVYDSQGRLQSMASSDGTFCYEYTYTSDGLPCEIFERVSGTSTVKKYDQNRRMIQEELANGITLTYANDSLGRPVKIGYPNQTSVEYLYDGIFLKKVIRNGGHNYTHTYTSYDLLGAPTKMKLIDKAGTVDLEYDRTGKTQFIKHPAWSESLPSENYDTQGNLLKIVVKDCAGTIETHYKYDILRQLHSESGNVSHIYKYDSNYNRLAKDGKIERINALNQLVRTMSCHFQYDPNGNLIKKSNEGSTSTYEYDSLDRLIRVESGKDRVCYAYDESNRRLSTTYFRKDKQVWVAFKTLRYLYHGQNEVGAADEKGSILQLRVLGVGKGAEIGGAVACELNGKVFAPIHDHNGNVAALIDATGKAEETYRYDAFGVELIFNAQGRKIEKSLVGNPWRFSSKRVDEESGWIFFGKRHYDPELGRWVTADPLGYAGGPNLYAYVMNSPLTHMDLYGLKGQEGVHSGKGMNAFESLVQGIGNFMSGLVQQIGWGISFLSYQMLPQMLKDPFGMLGEFLTQGTLRHYIPSYREQHSMACNSQGGRYAEPHVVMYIPGQMTTYEDAIEQASLISRTHGGVEVHFVHNGTHGIVTDLGETLILKMGLSTNVVNATMEMVDVVNRTYGISTPKTLYGFSQGGQIIDSMRGYLSKEQMRSIHVVTLGSAKMVMQGDFASAINFVSWKDFIPFIADFPGMIRSLFMRDCTIVFMGSTEIPFLGHKFMAQAYQDIINQYGNAYQDAYGPVIF